MWLWMLVNQPTVHSGGGHSGFATKLRPYGLSLKSFFYIASQCCYAVLMAHIYQENTLMAFCTLKQCVANIRIFGYIRIIIDKYIHLSNYSFDLRVKNMFGHSFVEFF